MGIEPPKGVLLYGPPGTGKTLCARAVANRTDACFIRVIGSELVQKYVGEGARMVRELFEMARSKKVSLAFVSWILEWFVRFQLSIYLLCILELNCFPKILVGLSDILR